MKQRLCCSCTESYNSLFFTIIVGHGSTLVDSMPLDRKVVSSNPILAATPGTLDKYIIYIIYCIYCIRLPVALRRVNTDTVNYCGRERLSFVVNLKRRYTNIRID